MINSYSEIYNLGHKAIIDLFKGPVIVEEKIDGSQISFGKIDGQLCIRSKSKEINLDDPEGLFVAAVDSIQRVAGFLIPNAVYRGEYLAKPKHNALCYSRIPQNNIIIFDIEVGGDFLDPHQKKSVAETIGMETVPVLYRGDVSDPAKLQPLLESVSILGGQKIEGVVIKPEKYDLFRRDKKVLMCKLVRPEFRELQHKTWKKEHATPGPGEILYVLAAELTTPARWQKAVIHLQESGTLQNDLCDIGPIMKEVTLDVAKECTDHIKEKLFAWAWPQLKCAVTRGVPEWYKAKLIEEQFKKD